MFKNKLNAGEVAPEYSCARQGLRKAEAMDVCEVMVLVLLWIFECGAGLHCRHWAYVRISMLKLSSVETESWLPPQVSAAFLTVGSSARDSMDAS